MYTGALTYDEYNTISALGRLLHIFCHCCCYLLTPSPYMEEEPNCRVHFERIGACLTRCNKEQSKKLRIYEES